MPNTEPFRRILDRLQWQSEAADLPPPIAAWLLQTESLTERLQSLCQDFRVEVKQEGWADSMWQREVCLIGCGRHLIFARTFVPKACAAEVLTLGNRALGRWLFPQQPQCLRREWAFDTESRLYARRTLHALNGSQISITELFLHDFPFER